MNKIIFVTVLLPFILGGCASSGDQRPWDSIQMGMPQDQVIELLGKPSAHTLDGNIEQMTYMVDEGGGWALVFVCGGAGLRGQPPPPECDRNSREKRFVIRLTDGQVTAYGKTIEPAPVQ